MLAVQVFRHRTYGYKGVIYGWDQTCERDQSWNDKFNVDPNQPFYCVLPDEVDCQRLFGGVRISKYVAQVCPLQSLQSLAFIYASCCCCADPPYELQLAILDN